MFIQNVEELQMRDLQVGESRDARIKRRAGSDDEGPKKDEFDDMEEGEEEGAKESVFAFNPKKAAVPVKKEGDEGDEEGEVEEEEKKPKQGLLSGIERSNPNHEKKAERSLKVKDLDGTPVAVDPEAGMNRKERYVPYNITVHTVYCMRMVKKAYSIIEWRRSPVIDEIIAVTRVSPVTFRFTWKRINLSYVTRSNDFDQADIASLEPLNQIADFFICIPDFFSCWHRYSE